ncbi:MAG: FG-GAP-like repeat-containing protein, partial [Verrucomicrobiota bacterium]
DGDLDLYVVSGSVEPAAPLRDRLYLNDGNANFEATADALPEMDFSGSVARAGDWDGDGDLDLFVGGRIVPGQYPLPAPSVLLRNDGTGRFSRAGFSDDKFPGRLGLVTDAEWFDYDDDERLDLIVSSEWGPVRVFRNEGKGFREVTEEAGLAGHSGWWLSLRIGDFDGDGDEDFVAGNFGRNTKYAPSAMKPELLFYGRFSGSEKPNLIEAKPDLEGDLLPRRGFSCSKEAMPFIDTKIETFTNFARSSLEEIYSPSDLEASQRFQVTTAETSLFLNDGKGQFERVALPPLAQIAPVFGIDAADADGDGDLDLVMAQNFYTPQRETGQMDGGLSLYLENAGPGSDPSALFVPSWPSRSGVVVPGDAKSAGFGDFDGDGSPDIVIGVNQSFPRLFLNRP